MADTDKKSETVVEETPKNEAETPSTPTAQPEEKQTDEELEALRKKAEQAEMRANQLANKLAEKEKAEADAQAKALEENEEWKTLAEQERAKREALEAQEEERKRKAELKKATSNVLADYSDEVKETAKDVGLELSDSSEEAVAEFKAKLDKINARVGASAVTPNNPSTPSNKVSLTPQEIHEMLNDPKKADEFFKKNAKDFPVTNLMMQ